MVFVFMKLLIKSLTNRFAAELGVADAGRFTGDGPPAYALTGSWGDGFAAAEAGRAEAGGRGVIFDFGTADGRGVGATVGFASSSVNLWPCKTVWLNSAWCTYVVQ